jgi:putative membrane protein
MGPCEGLLRLVYTNPMSLLIRLLINAAALWLAARYVSGIDYTGTLPGLLVVALVFGIVNTILKPVLKFLALPVRILTLGLFTLVINAGMLWLTARLVAERGFSVSGVRAAFVGALFISVVSALLNLFVPDDDKDD